ncbi:MAG: DUF1211 domain-containing protein [Dehalococcoidia bacterium]|nr:MAG: DUF1211 domain-containing protein [Dehalococcoidia bacterium]
MKISRGNKSSNFLSPHRIEALTDGVFAIVMTLLVLEFSIPIISEASVKTELPERLMDLLPSFASHVLSFVVLGMFWFGHHFAFQHIKRTNGTLVGINIIFLLLVALIPFTTSLVNEYYMEQLPAILWGANAFLIFIMRYILWAYATGNHRLVDDDIEPDLVKSDKIQQLLGFVILPIAMCVSFFSVAATYSIYYVLALFFMVMILGNYGIFRSKSVNKKNKREVEEESNEGEEQ